MLRRMEKNCAPFCLQRSFVGLFRQCEAILCSPALFFRLQSGICSAQTVQRFLPVCPQMGIYSKSFQVFMLQSSMSYFSFFSRNFVTFPTPLTSFHGTFICSSKPAGANVIGIDLGTTNSCVSVMEGKV